MAFCVMVDTGDCETVVKSNCNVVDDEVCSTAMEEREIYETKIERECRKTKMNVCEEVNEPKCLTVVNTFCSTEAREICSKEEGEEVRYPGHGEK